MKPLLLPLMLVIMTGVLFSQTTRNFQWDEATALSRPEDQILNSIITRLLLSREVAWSKFCNHAKVRDLAREAKVLADLKQAGRKIGLTPEQVNSIFKPQIVASCRLQEELIAGWRSGFPRPQTSPKDLKAEIRPLLDKVDGTLLLQWKALSNKSFDRADYYSAVEGIQEQGFSTDIAKIAARPLGPQ
jgi:chorismate mutase-like protein